ncbi:hypothetical protein SFA35_02375 [Pseudomonas sp. HR96]|uniref:hypothetical protein n=1 Tax=Pseudomonas sp. HR96 TaxID=1027966 RepID=UPI002A759B00|nr:hypothetical protein [Pseudomonas sp. HR96]WPP00259.1 hypothetical protein SFA35_02375 [Pseudomonas sp. HR96]
MTAVVRYAGAALLAALLAACASKPPLKPPPTQAARPAAGCEQSDWQAQTAPVINKRLGPDVLEQYDGKDSDSSGCH